jgi:hypothetical protein
LELNIRRGLFIGGGLTLLAVCAFYEWLILSGRITIVYNYYYAPLLSGAFGLGLLVIGIKMTSYNDNEPSTAT